MSNIYALRWLISVHTHKRRFDRIPDEFRSMKRLWRGKGLDGLLARRDREADLFEVGLKLPVTLAAKPAPPSRRKAPTSIANRIGCGAAFVSAFGAIAQGVGGHAIITAAAVIVATLVVIYVIRNPKPGD